MWLPCSQICPNTFHHREMRLRNDTRKLEVLLSPGHQMEWEWVGPRATGSQRFLLYSPHSFWWCSLPPELLFQSFVLLVLFLFFYLLFKILGCSTQQARREQCSWSKQQKQQTQINTIKILHNQQIQTEKGLHHQRNWQSIRPGTGATEANLRPWVGEKASMVKNNKLMWWSGLWCLREAYPLWARATTQSQTTSNGELLLFTSRFYDQMGFAIGLELKLSYADFSCHQGILANGSQALQNGDGQGAILKSLKQHAAHWQHFCFHAGIHMYDLYNVYQIDPNCPTKYAHDSVILEVQNR